MARRAAAYFQDGDMATSADVARWMLEEVRGRGLLEQERAAHEITRRFGDGFTYVNDNGNLSIEQRVLKAFIKLSGEDVIWARLSHHWRQRREDDEPGRAQYE